MPVELLAPRKALAGASIVVAALLAAGLVAIGASSLVGAILCPPLGEAETTRLIAFVQKRLAPPGAANLKISRSARLNASCYRKLDFVSGTGLHFALFASPDLRFLSTDLMDSRAESANNGKLLQKDLSGDRFPSRGSLSAPVTIVVFSDFECPFCASFAGSVGEVGACQAV
jgi:protein-disulfide isomerase